MPITVSEALAEIKTIEKRLEKKWPAIFNVSYRPDHMKDPYEKDGGSAEFISRERQSSKDLEERIVFLRSAITLSNMNTKVEVCGETRTIADWIVWRRDVVPMLQKRLHTLVTAIAAGRALAQKQGGQVKAAGDLTETNKSDIVVNVNERELAGEIEHLEEILGTLDGKLSVSNAITQLAE